MCTTDAVGGVKAYRVLSSTDRSTLWVAIAVLALFSGVLGCSPQEQGTGGLTAQEEQALADTFEAQTRESLSAFSELDPELYFQRFSEDFRHYYRAWYSRDQFEEIVRKYMASYQEVSATLEEADAEVLGPDAGVVTGRYQMQLVDSAGNSSEQGYDFTAVMERRDGQWKVVRLHESAAQ